ncbi:putative clathrin light chain [Lupinus albus]|uniref:Putative clathrin light chain n=1 Tax=Lupinus albus TaxID=3870 RepID=A0A6A4R5U1_LUPAL|nr:putative clathrin light chain [Lupinus albus]
MSLCSQHAIQLEEKEKGEKELRAKIIEEVEEYKVAFYEKMTLNVDTNKVQNRERENLYLANQEKFHKEVDKNYWKAICEIILARFLTLRRREEKKNRIRSQPLRSSKAQSLTNPSIFLGCSTYC